MASTKISERQIGLKTGGNYTLLKDYLDRIKATRCPFNETQTFTGLTASDGIVIIPTLIPANAAIPDNLKISNSAYTTTAKEGGILSMIGTETTGFTTPGTFVWENVTVVDDYGNILNAVQIRAEATHDPIYDTNGREVFGLIIRCFGTADDTAIAANPNENLEICFVVNDGTGTLAKATGGVSGAIEFNLNRAFASRFEAKIALEGGNAVDVDVIADLTVVHLSEYLVTTAFGAGETLNLTSGAGSGTGLSTRSGDATQVALNASEVLFDADNTCECSLNGIEGKKGNGLDFEWVSANTILVLDPLDIGDVVQIQRKY